MREYRIYYWLMGELKEKPIMAHTLRDAWSILKNEELKLYPSLKQSRYNGIQFHHAEVEEKSYYKVN